MYLCCLSNVQLIALCFLRVRKMKERYAQSSMRKQTNRMIFAEVCCHDVLLIESPPFLLFFAPPPPPSPTYRLRKMPIKLIWGSPKVNLVKGGCLDPFADQQSTRRPKCLSQRGCRYCISNSGQVLLVAHRLWTNNCSASSPNSLNATLEPDSLKCKYLLSWMCTI